MPSRESSLRNLKKAQANGRPPRPWRSRAETRAIRMITWQWLLDRGPWCSVRALARWLGVSHTYIQKLARTLPRNESDFLRQVRYFGAPSIDGLRRAREESRKQRERGFLRTQPRWKWVEFNIGGTIVRDRVPTKPNAATLPRIRFCQMHRPQQFPAKVSSITSRCTCGTSESMPNVRWQ